MVMYLSCMSYHVRCLIDYCGLQHILYAEARSRSNVFCIHVYKQNRTEYTHIILNAVLIIVFRKISPNNLCYCQGNIELHGTSHMVWITKCQCIHVKLANISICETDVNWEKEFHCGTKPRQAELTPRECAWLSGEYIGSPLSLPASVWQRCRGGLAAFP